VASCALSCEEVGRQAGVAASCRGVRLLRLEGEEWHRHGGCCILGSSAGMWKKVFQHVGLASVMLDVVNLLGPSNKH
jgi:hypothetical protein